MVVANNEIDETKNAGKSTTILMAMAIQQYDAGRIARWSTSGASLKATGCRHRASACAVLPQRPPWLTNSNKTHKTLTKHNF
jgi:ABC-type cobalamin/Fe3+-siderophores transport system ATPase subunit